MTDSLDARAKRIIDDLIESSADAGHTVIDRACGGDQELAARVRELLTSIGHQDEFLSDPTVAVPPGMEEPGTSIGPYKLLERLGEGGFGSVWAAEQREPFKRRVALKIIKLGMDTRQVIARFEAERQALALMDHPNIAKVFDAGSTETGRPYFVMELVKGVPILEYCDSGKLDTRSRLELFTRVCLAIQHAHQKGIIHRDIKPSNVLITLHDGEPVPKVIDFGIAKATNAELTEKTIYTQHRQMIGTPAYMSPEQAEMSGLDIDTRSDIYSLGVLLYELLTGTTPFTNDELMSKGFEEMMRIIREVEPPRPSTRLSSLGDTASRTAEERRLEVPKLRSILRGDLDWIVMKCLEKDRQRRYDTASGLATDIDRHLAGEPVAAAPPSAVYRFRKLVRRHRGRAIAAGIVAAALVLGMIGTGLALKRALRAESGLRDQLIETQAAHAAEKARADELDQVADFQARMLGQVSATEAGAKLTEDFNRRYAAALEKAGVPEPERGAQVDAFRGQWARVNATDAAAALLDETIMKPAVKHLDEQFKDQPAVDSQLRQVLAIRYREMGLDEKSLPLQRQAMETRRRVMGEDDPRTLASIRRLGTLLEDQGRFAEAEPYLREALEKRRRVLGEENPDTLTSIDELGNLLLVRGRLAEAEPYLREALEKRRRVIGEENEDTLTSVENMGSLLRAQGKVAEAEPYLREAMEKSRRVLGEEHSRTLHAIDNMGYLLQRRGKLSEAEPYLREALEKSRRVFGEDHPATLHSIGNFGSLLQDQGRFAEAEPYLREAVEKSRRVFGEEHPDMLAITNNMAILLQNQGKLAEAEPYLREVLEKSRRMLGEQHPATLQYTSNLGILLKNLGKLAEAEALDARGLTTCEGAFPSAHPLTALLLHHHADVLRMLRRLDDALADGQRAADMYRAHPDWAPDEAGHAYSILATILTAQGKTDEALAARRDQVAIQRATLAPGSIDLSNALAPFGLALIQRGTLDAAKEAEPLLRECLEIRARTMAANDWRVANTRSVLGGALLLIAELDPALTPTDRIDRLREAEPLLVDGYAGLKDNPAVPSPQRAGGDRRKEALERVVHLYEVWDKAEPRKGYDSKAAEWKKGLDAESPASDPARK